MRKIFIIWMMLFGQSALAAGDVDYQVSFDNAAHHEAEISATFTGIENDTFEVRMSRASPGRYALHEYAKNVYNVKAVNSNGEPLMVTRPNPYAWNISGHDGEVTVSYTLFANRGDGTYSQVDRTHAHLNIPATFMWAKEFENSPVQVNFKPFDESWKVATQLVRTDDPYQFSAPDLAYFMDSPVELSDHQVSSWTARSNNKDYTIKIALHHDGSEEDLDEYTRQAMAVVDEQIKVYGELPDFDYGEYVFIACYLPHVSGDGMEHRNSTILTSTSSLEENEFGQLGTLSHEFFHIWNVERIRPKTLEPFDFTGQNMTKNLWFAEGFTSYYGDLLIRRAGETSVEDYLETVSDIVNQANLVPGRLYFTPEEASMMATFTDAGTAIDRTNFRNIFFSYYIYGRSRALALDLAIRANYPGKSLDDYMALMWKDFGENEKPYDRDDLRETLGKMLGDKDFADKFFADHIHGKKVPDYETLLRSAGLSVTKAEEGEPSLGPVDFTFDERKAIVLGSVQVGTPLYDAGIERGDQIVRLAGRRIRSQSSWDRAIARNDVAETVTIEYISRGENFERDITFIEEPDIVVEKMDGTEDQQAFLSSWIGQD